MSSTLVAPPVHEIGFRVEDAVPVLTVPAHLSYDELVVVLGEGMPSLVREIAGRTSRLDFGERSIHLLFLRRLISHLSQEHNVEISGLYLRHAHMQRFAERELKLKLFVNDGANDLLPEEAKELAVDDAPVLAGLSIPTSKVADEPKQEPSVQEHPEPVVENQVAMVKGRRTLHVNRTLRSGNSVRFDGDLLVMGDVNPGAQVTASGNILVFGALKGIAHAGASGDEACFILSFDLQPIQVRIARKIAIKPAAKAPRSGCHPEWATIQGDKIIIEPYSNKLFR